MAMEATNAVYADYEKMLLQAVYKAMKRWGGSFDDWLSDANDVFMYACGRYKKKKGNKFGTYLYFLLNVFLVERLRKELKQRTRLPCQPLQGWEYNIAVSHRIFELPAELSEDARIVVGLVFDMPADIKLALVQMDRLPEDFEQEIKAGRTIGRCIKDFLADLNWSTGRIDQTFDEIRRCL